MQQEVVLAPLAEEPSHGYQLRRRPRRHALGPIGEGDERRLLDGIG
jgi:DNA-binding PadR family transcriptional regulator